jgi:hypothetical protein
VGTPFAIAGRHSPANSDSLLTCAGGYSADVHPSGLTGDAVMAGLDSDFVDSVTTDMRAGMTALIVEADEKSTRPVDDIVSLGGGHVYRQAA